MLNVNFNEAQIIGWISFNGGDVFFIESRHLHGLPHRNAIGVQLCQPVCIELSYQSA